MKQLARHDQPRSCCFSRCATTAENGYKSRIDEAVSASTASSSPHKSTANLPAFGLQTLPSLGSPTNRIQHPSTPSVVDRASLKGPSTSYRLAALGFSTSPPRQLHAPSPLRAQPDQYDPPRPEPRHSQRAETLAGGPSGPGKPLVIPRYRRVEASVEARHSNSGKRPVRGSPEGCPRGCYRAAHVSQPTSLEA